MADSTIFPQFVRLIPELRTEIWQYALPRYRRLCWNSSTDRVCTLLGDPYNGLSLLLVCKESKIVVEHRFVRMRHQLFSKPQFLYVDIETDVIRFELLYVSRPFKGPRQPALTICAPQESRHVKRLYIDNVGFKNVRLAVVSLCATMMCRELQVEEFLIVFKRHKKESLLASEREEFLRYLKILMRPGLWAQDEDMIKEAKLVVELTHQEGPLIRRLMEKPMVIPRVLFDIDDLVADRDFNEPRGEFDLALVEGEPEKDQDLIRKWDKILFACML